MEPQQAAELGRLIRERRKELGLTLRQVAEQAGMNFATVGRIEQGLFAVPGPDKLARLAEALGLSTADLYGLADYSVPDELPSFRPYLRGKYGDMPVKAVDDLNKASSGSSANTATTPTDHKTARTKPSNQQQRGGRHAINRHHHQQPERTRLLRALVPRRQAQLSMSPCGSRNCRPTGCSDTSRSQGALGSGRDHHELPRIRIEREHGLPVSGAAHWNGCYWVITLNADDHPLRQRFSLMHEFKHVLDHTTRGYLYGDVRTAAPTSRPSASPTTSPRVS